MIGLNLEGKIVIVTGGTVGIGKTICRVFLESGAFVVFTSRNSNEGLKVQNEFKRINKNCLFVKCDSTKEENIDNLMKVTENNFSKIDVLVNNAAAYIYKIMDKCSSDDFDYIYKTNLRGYFLTCKYAVPYLKKTKGNIVNISSIVGEVGQYYTSLYCATKGGITAFTKAIALDYAKDQIRANAILPGVIDTNASNIGRKGNRLEYPKELVEISSKIQPLGRKECTTEEVAYVTLFLSSNLASGITGTTIIVDRGATLDFSPGLKTFYDD